MQTLEEYVREVEETVSRFEGQKQNIAIFGMRQRAAEVKYLLNQYDHVRLEKINNQIVFSEQEQSKLSPSELDFQQQLFSHLVQATQKVALRPLNLHDTLKNMIEEQFMKDITAPDESVQSGYSLNNVLLVAKFVDDVVIDNKSYMAGQQIVLRWGAIKEYVNDGRIILLARVQNSNEYVQPWTDLEKL